MNPIENLSILDIQQIAQMIKPHLGGSHIIYLGVQADMVVSGSLAAGLNIQGFELDQTKSGFINFDKCDAIIAHWKTIVDLEGQFITACVEKRAEFWVIYTLLDINSEFLDIFKSLMRFGFLRDTGIELWVGNRILVCRYLYSDDLGVEFSKHESEWWRLVQANRKYQDLVNEYFNENVMLLTTSKEYERRNRELEQGILKIQESNRLLEESNRSLAAQWDAFWKSRTGKTLSFLKRITRR